MYWNPASLGMAPTKGIIDSIMLPFVLAIKTRRQRIVLIVYTHQALKIEARRSAFVAKHRAQIEKATRLYIKTHLLHVRRVAEFNAYDKLFALWHKVHLPFFVILLISVIVHVLAVHLY